MRKIFCLAAILLVFLPCAAQTRFLLTGRVTDAESGGPLAGATVYSKEYPNLGAVSGADGNFSLSLPAGRHTVACVFLGYENSEKGVNMDRQREVFFRMSVGSNTIDEVVVTSRSLIEKVSGVQIGVETIEIAEMAKMPALFGERDIMRTLQLLPGIKSEGDGSSGFQVRGGTSAQNLVLIDDAPVYNAGHAIGIFSAFNDNALNNASLYKGQIPAQYGGGTSSVFDVTTRSGDLRRYKVDGSIGLLSAKASVEGPFAKDKASFFVAGRRSYLDMFLKLTEKYKDNVVNFYDVNAKVYWNAGEKNKFFVSFFTGRDNLGLEELADMKWGNTTSTARWFHRFNDKLYSNTSLIYASYITDNNMDILDIEARYDGFIKQGGIKESLVWSPNGRHTLKMGFQSMCMDVKSAEWKMDYLEQREQRSAWDNNIWVNEEWKISDKVNISAGLRLNIFSALGGSPYYVLDAGGGILETLDYARGEIVATHVGLEPRFSMNWRVADKQSVKLGYSRTSQNIHAVRNTSSSMPFDRYTISSNIVKPQLADQVSLGYVALTRDNMYEFSAEAYYKDVQNVIDYKDGKSVNSEIEIERIILAGKGRAYGIEFLARKNLGRLTGWVAYTLSWSQNKIDGINNDRWYTASNDRRHDISVVAMYDLTERWSLSATWVFNTGQAMTAPSAKYEIDGHTMHYYAERNGYRAPNYHRLDVSATYTKKKKNYTSEWAFGIYNVYCRYNPYIIIFEDSDAKPSGTKTMQYSLFGIIPSVSYNFRF